MNSEQITDFIGIIGIIIGSLLTFLMTYILKNSDNKWKLNEKVISKRIQAHESLQYFINELNLTVGYKISDRKVRTCVKIFSDPDIFLEWNNQFTIFISKNFIWFSQSILEEIQFFNEYLEALRKYFADNEVGPVGLMKIGDFLKYDLEKIGKTFSLLVKDYFAYDLTKVVIEKDYPFIDKKLSSHEVKEHYRGYDLFKSRKKLNSILSN